MFAVGIIYNTQSKHPLNLFTFLYILLNEDIRKQICIIYLFIIDINYIQFWHNAFKTMLIFLSHFVTAMTKWIFYYLNLNRLRIKMLKLVFFKLVQEFFFSNIWRLQRLSTTQETSNVHVKVHCFQKKTRIIFFLDEINLYFLIKELIY